METLTAGVVELADDQPLHDQRGVDKASVHP
jgi:hypothetical protein